MTSTWSCSAGRVQLHLPGEVGWGVRVSPTRAPYVLSPGHSDLALQPVLMLPKCAGRVHLCQGPGLSPAAVCVTLSCSLSLSLPSPCLTLLFCPRFSQLYVSNKREAEELGSDLAMRLLTEIDVRKVLRGACGARAAVASSGFPFRSNKLGDVSSDLEPRGEGRSTGAWELVPLLPAALGITTVHHPGQMGIARGGQILSVNPHSSHKLEWE